MKGKAILVSGLALVLLLTFVAPAMAGSPKKIEVTAVPSGTVVQPGYTTVVNPGEIAHLVDNMIWTGTITLNVPGQAPLVGTFVDVIDGMRVRDLPGGVEHKRVNEGIYHFKEVWTFPGGTFEGISQVQTHGPSFSVFEAHIVLQGSGVFKGQTLYLSLERPPTPAFYTGELLIP